MPHLIAYAMIIWFLSVLVAQPSHACSCPPHLPPYAALRQAIAVFSGKVLEVEVSKTEKHVTLEVLRVWKGELGGTVAITTPRYGPACGVAFSTEGDAKYLIYSHMQDEEEGKLATNSCTRTRPLSEAEEDLQVLGEGKPRIAPEP
jgi:hypothetical protein